MVLLDLAVCFTTALHYPVVSRTDYAPSPSATARMPVMDSSPRSRGVGAECPLSERQWSRKIPSPPPGHHWVRLAQYGNGPMGVACARRPSVPGRTPRTAPRIDHQLGTGAELPPLPGDVRRSSV
jgi:hypothetical protein